MTEEKTFEPITSQEAFDERIKARLAREREKWGKESGTEDLEAQLAAKEEEISQIQRANYRANARRAVLDELASHGVSEQGRIERVLQYVDLDAIEATEGGEPYFGSVRQQLASISKDLPELLDFRLGAGSGPGSKKPVLTEKKALTREDVEQMDAEQINSNWDRVKGFLAGERS